jgi:hypothetical protein
LEEEGPVMEQRSENLFHERKPGQHSAKEVRRRAGMPVSRTSDAAYS